MWVAGWVVSWWVYILARKNGRCYIQAFIAQSRDVSLYSLGERLLMSCWTGVGLL
jgi:hypothetical protein